MLKMLFSLIIDDYLSSNLYIIIYENIKIIMIARFLSFALLFPNSRSIGTYCDICNEAIVSEYYIDAWGNKFHGKHLKNGICNIE